MSSYIYDTRFFIEYFYSKDDNLLSRMKDNLRKASKRVVSVITLHEIFKLILEKEGREVAKLRVTVISKDFRVVDVDSDIAIEAAEIRSKYRIPMTDSIIAATAKTLNLPVISDDEHFYKIKEVRATWIK